MNNNSAHKYLNVESSPTAKNDQIKRGLYITEKRKIDGFDPLIRTDSVFLRFVLSLFVLGKIARCIAKWIVGLVIFMTPFEL